MAGAGSGTVGKTKEEKALEKARREEERQEKLRQKELEKQRKDEEKRKREEERQRKEAEREAERLKKEEEKRKREEEKKKKDEEKKQELLKKEEERQRKDEEKKRKEEEKKQELLKKEEEKKKREDEKTRERLKTEQAAKRQADLLLKFLNVSKTPTATGSPSCTETPTPMEVDTTDPQSPEDSQLKFKPFQVKSGMTLAPLHRRPPASLLTVKKELFPEEGNEGEGLKNSAPFEPYLLELKKRGGRKSSRTSVHSKDREEDDEVMIIEPKMLIEHPAEAGLIKYRWKLLQFRENHRPPYWGTWKRRSQRVKARRPFAKEVELDYEFDSDDEWEEEPEDGEELGDQDDADKEEDEKMVVGEEDEDVDEDDEDDFLVPHGYLSDDEGGVDEYRDKDTLKYLEEEFYRDLKREKINGYPVIETDDLEEYRMIFCPDDDEIEGGRESEDEQQQVDVVLEAPAPLTLTRVG